MSLQGILSAVCLGAALALFLLAALESAHRGYGRGCFTTLAVLMLVLAGLLATCRG